MIEERKLLKDIGTYTGTMYLVQVMSFARGVIVARLLGPLLYGYFSGLGLILLFNANGHLGVLQGMFREMAIKKGAGDLHQIDELKNNAFSFILFSAGLIFLLLVGYSVFNQGVMDPHIVWGVRAYALICILQHQEMLYQDLLRVDNRFAEINVSKLIFAVTNLILSVVFVILWKFYGLLYAFILSMVAENCYLTLRTQFRFAFVFDRQILWRLLKNGFPIAVSLMTLVLLNSVDRMMIIYFLTSRELGYYSVALGFALLLFNFAETISYVIQPRILEHYGKHGGDATSLIKIYEKSTLLLSVVMSLMVGIMIIAIEPVITYLLPNYIDGITVTKILFIGIFFFSVNQICLRILMAIASFGTLVTTQVFVIVLSFTFNYYAIQHEYGITGIAIASSIAYAVYCFVCIHVMYLKLNVKVGNAIIKNLTTYFPILFTGVILYGICHIPLMQGIQLAWTTMRLGIENAEVVMQLTYVMIQITILLICFLPPFVILEKQLHIISSLKKPNYSAWQNPITRN